ncbi:MAG: hypothetical protein ACRCUT_10790, partial [Spirochaetota bacterium]
VKTKNSPTEKEFTDAQGEKWIQTSTEDIFSLRELNSVIESIEKEKDKGEIVLARIDFRTVNKEYYDTIQSLQAKLQHKDDLLKKLVTESKRVISRKNSKMLEMIEYIKQLQLLVAYNNLDAASLKKIQINPAEILAAHHAGAEEEEAAAEYETVSEITLNDDGEEILPR